MMIAPITPVNEIDDGIFGMNPSSKDPIGGEEYKKFIRKQMNIITTSTPNISSKTFWPSSWIDSMPITKIIDTAIPERLETELIRL